MKVSIIVTAYLEQSKPYLDLCMTSVAGLNRFYPHETETILVTPHWYKPEYPNVRLVHPEKEKYSNAHAINFGVQSASSDSEYYFILNDDTILTKNCLVDLVTTSKRLDDWACVMPIGNDQMGKYYLETPRLIGPYRLESIKGHEAEMMALNSPYHFGLMFFDSLCLYAFLVPKRVWEGVGPFDESFGPVGQDDIDWSRRVVKSGFINAVSMNALVWHAGGASADITMGALNSKARAESLEPYNKKWVE